MPSLAVKDLADSRHNQEGALLSAFPVVAYCPRLTGVRTVRQERWEIQGESSPGSLLGQVTLQRTPGCLCPPPIFMWWRRSHFVRALVLLDNRGPLLDKEKWPGTQPSLVAFARGGVTQRTEAQFCYQEDGREAWTPGSRNGLSLEIIIWNR